MTDNWQPIQSRVNPPAPAQVTTETPVEQPEDQGLGDTIASGIDAVGDFISDIPRGVVDGVSNAGQSVADLTVGSVIRGGISAYEKITGDDVEYDGRAPEPMQFKQGAGGAIADGITRFTLGFASGANLLRAAGWARGGSKALNYLRSFTAGGFSDFTMFKGDEGRLADLASEYPALDKFIPEYLESDEDDSELEGRFKNLLEGGAIGVTGDALLTSMRGLKTFNKFMKAGKEEQAYEALAQAKLDVHDMLDTQSDALDTIALKTTPEKQAELVENIKGRLNETGDAYRALEEDDAFNYDVFDLDDDPVQAIQAVAQVMGDLPEGTRNFAKVYKDAADMFGQTEAEFLENIGGTVRGVENLDSTVVALKAYTQSIARQADQANKLLFKNPEDVDAQILLGKSMKNMAQVQSIFKKVQTNTARGLNAHKIVPSEDLSTVFTDPELEALAQGKLPTDKVRVLSDRLQYLEGKPHAMTRVIRHGYGRFVDVHNEYWQNAILSGAGTQEIAFVSNALKSLSMNVDRMVAGTMTGDKELAREGVDMLVGQLMNIREGMRMAGKALKAERNFGDPEGLIDDVLPSRLIKKGDGKILGNGIDGMFMNTVGRVINAPRQGLGAQDEFFKTMNYRAYVRTKALREARANNLDPQKTAEFVQRRLDASIAEDGRFMDKNGREFARQSTFTTDLGEGSLGHTVQSAVVKHPTLRIFAPFVRTPVNLFREVHRRTPLIGRYQFQQKQRLARGGEEAAIAKAEIAQGYAMYGMAAMAVMNGKVTGKAPEEQGLREAFYGQGKKEYSVLINGKWYPYRKLDPFGSFLGLVADGVAISGELDADKWEDTIPVIIGSITSNLASKTFLSDSIEKLNALTSGEGWEIEKQLQKQWGSYLPNALRQSNSDPYLREARGYMDEMMKGVRGYSEKLQPRRNAFGEPIEASTVPYRIMQPFVGAPMKDDKLYKELEQIGKGISPLPRSVANGRIDLEDPELADENGKTPFDRWAELMGKPIGRKTLRQSLEQLIESSRWQSLSDSTDMYSTDSSKYKVVMGRVEKYRAKHFQQVLKEYPKLKNALMNDKRNKAKAFRGEDLLPLVE